MWIAMAKKVKRVVVTYPVKKERKLMKTRFSARLWRLTRPLVGVSVVMCLALWAAAPSNAMVGIAEFDGEVVDIAQDGTLSAATRAATSPDHASASFALTTELRPELDPIRLFPTGNLKDLTIELPPGLVGDPTATAARCTDIELLVGGGESNDANPSGCPVDSQVGVVFLEFAGARPEPAALGSKQVVPLFNMEVSRPGVVAQLGFNSFISGPVYLEPEVRTESDYGINVLVRNASQAGAVIASRAVLFGVPAAPVNDALRGNCAGLNNPVFGLPPSPPVRCGTTAPARPFITLPTHCAGPVTTTMSVTSWQTPDRINDTASFLSHKPAPNEDELVGVEQCATVPFSPTMTVQPRSAQAGAPSGYTIELEVPENDDPLAVRQAHLKTAVVTLPQGVRMNPAAADGLQGCTDEQIALTSRNDEACPGGSRIGSVSVRTPVLEQELKGSVYLGTQVPTARYRIFLVVKGPGVMVKLAGTVDPDPVTGQLTTTFASNPQLPFSEMELVFKGGARAPLVNPDECGTHTMTSVMMPWSGNAPATPSASFEIDCPGKPGGLNPSFEAGTTNPSAAEHTAFSLRLSREDGMQEFRELKDISLPGGLAADVGSVDLCPAANADAGTCPEASRIGHVQAAAGAGSNPLWVPQAGKKPTAVYLTGPYKGAPYGLSVVVPAQAGPFDLGTVVVRSALHVDERTAAITSGVDETRLISPDGSETEVLPGVLPRILEGIVLNQREIRVIVDREGFMLNPTDCSPKQITANVGGYGGASSHVSSRFRAADCARLGFAPRFRARILDKGRRSTLRSFNPRTRFTVVPRPGDANIGGARVALPSSTILDQSNLDTTCTRERMAAENCPAGSVVGFAKAWSPLLRRPVQGPVYLAANGGARPLPDLLAVLDGELRVSLLGEISTLRSRGKARLQNTFRVVPDAPVTRFVLTMRGGKQHGLLVNSTDLCRSRERGVAVFHGQNGRRHRTALRLTPSFKGCGKVRRQARKKPARKKARQSRVLRGSDR